MAKFSLLKALNDAVNNRPLDERAIEVINEGRAEMRKAGINYSGSIVLPVAEERGIIAAGTASMGAETIQEDKLNLLGPLRANSVLASAGATFMSGLVGNFSLPFYSGSSATWESENGAAKDGSGSFSEVKFSPKRLTTYITVSKQFLVQDSTNAEELLRRDIIRAIQDKLEATIFGDGAGGAYEPKGLFSGATAMSTISLENIVGLEEQLETANVPGDKKFVVSPSVKAKMKTTKIDTGSGIMLMGADNTVNGYPVLTSSNVKGLCFGNFEELVVAQFGSIDIIADPYTEATNGAIKLVVNSYWDVQPRRAEAIIAKTVTASK